MKKPDLTIQKVQELHKAGKLDEAREGYIRLLKDNPHDVAAMHLMGVLLAEQGDLDRAKEYLQKAITLSPNDPVLYLHLANILKANHLLSPATEVLLQVTHDHPRFAAGFNNLGTVYFAQEKWLDAICAYQAAIDIQSNYIDAYYNLGLAFSKLSRYKEAIHVYQSLLQLSPYHPGGQFQLGCLLMQAHQYDEAINHFLTIVNEHPFHFESQFNLASCFLKLGQLHQAKTYYLKALEVIPDDIQVLFNLGVISMQQGRMLEAIDYYLRIVANNPDFYDAHHNLGVAFLAIKNKEKALFHLREALRIKPNHPSIEHTIHALLQNKQLSSSPPEYIQTLFDSYADHYDSHLLGSLHYQVPQLFYQAVKDFAVFTSSSLDILDLGSGTGLCGELFKPHARTLTGVDISEKMLQMAAQKKIYDELVKSDIVPFLQDKKAVYDLILAGDVLVYFGDLVDIFSGVSQALRDHGLFVFNTEITDSRDYELQVSGRFSHHEAYIRQLAHQYQLRVLLRRVTPLRSHHEENLLGSLFVLQK